MRRKLNTLAGALLGALLVLTIPLVIAAEGDTNWTNGLFSGDVTIGDDLSVADDATIAGDLTVSGTLTGPTLIDVTAPYTFTADVTLSGSGTDLLFNAANQNTIGSATKGAKEVFTRKVTGETGTALTLSSATGITVDGTMGFGSTVPTLATSRTLWIPATEFGLPSSNPAALSEQALGKTLTFADSSADDNAFFLFRIPDDFDRTNSLLHFRVLYNLPSGTPDEGHWAVECLGVADGGSDAAPSTGSVGTVLDTPSGNDKWDLTSAAVVAASVVGGSTVAVGCNLWHDVDDPFGGTVHVLGVRVGYTTDKNY